MINFRAVERDHVLTALEAYDAAGGSAFLSAHGRAADAYELVLSGRRYDATAILGVAHGLATGYTPGPTEFTGGAAGAAKVLRGLGFEVSGPPTDAVAPVRKVSKPRATRPAATPRARKPEPRPATICPTCFMAIPATGVCDNCG